MVRLPVWRARLAVALLLAAFAVLAGRSVYLQSMHTVFLQGKGEARYARVLEVPATRGRVVDRNGDALAISTPVKSVWAIPEDVKAILAELRQQTTARNFGTPFVDNPGSDGVSPILGNGLLSLKDRH